MKKKAFISVILALTLLLSSCSVKIKGKNDNTSSADKDSNATEIQLNTDYKLTDDISFKLVKAGETPLILDTSGSGHGYEPYSSSTSYVDLIFDITNSSSTDFNCAEYMNIEVEYDHGLSLSSYGNDSEDEPKSIDLDGTFVGENEGWASMSTFSKAIVPAGKTVRVHYFVGYLKNLLISPTYKYLISYDDGRESSDGETSDSSNPVYKFTYKESMGTLCDTLEIKLKETFTIENYANITLENVKFADTLTPSSTWGGGYNYWEPSEYGKKFLIFKFKIENLSTEDVIVGTSSIHGLITNTIKTLGDSYYISGTFLEEKYGKELSRTTAIDPGATKTAYVAFEVPTIFEKLNNYEVTFMAGGSFYTYQSENYGEDTSSDTSSDVSSETNS